MAFRKVEPVKKENLINTTGLVEESKVIETTVRKIIHISKFDYYGKDDFSKVLLDASKDFHKYFDSHRKSERFLFYLMCRCKFIKEVENEQSDDSNFWSCNLIFARNLFCQIFERSKMDYRYVENMNCDVSEVTLTNPNIIEYKHLLPWFDEFKLNIKQLKCWKICGENTPI